MKRPIPLTYDLLRHRLQFHRPISLRKQVCLQYLKWGTTKYREDRDKFVELAKKWRKEDKKIGAHRTLLEKRARKLFQMVRKDKADDKRSEATTKYAKRSVKEGTGLHSPEQQALRAERNRENARKRKESGEVWAHYWIVYPPEGEPFKIYNLTAFCREHGLNQSHMCRTAINPKRRKHHKGWRAEKYDPTWDNLE
jgi:hypothetical protein